MFGQRRGLFKRPTDDDDDDGGRRQVKAKPLAPDVARRLEHAMGGETHRARAFVTASATNQREFYGEQTVHNQRRPADDEGDQQKSSSSADVDRTLTSEERNKLSARILKAQLVGKTDLAVKLKRQLENGVAAQCETATTSSTANSSDILLTTTDSRTGVTRPTRMDDKTLSDSDSIRRMVEIEKSTTADDQLNQFMEMAGKKSAKEKTDDDWTVDDVLLTKKKSRKKEERRREKERGRAVADHKRFEETLESCPYCVESPKLRKHTIVAMGLKTYLCVPHEQSLADGHCLIVPMMHAASVVQLDEDVYDEMKIWRKGLVALYADREEDCVFAETAKNVQRQPHTVVECLPMPRAEGDAAPLYFRKALLESEDEWKSQNRKLLDLSKKDLRRSVPKGFSYFAVDFGLQHGFAHVIEDENRFSTYFAKEVVGGMLDLNHNLWRRPQKMSFEEQKKKADAMKLLWKPYDWTERVKSAVARQQDEEPSD